MMNFTSVLNANEMDPMCGGLKLSRTQRMYGFGTCFAVGFLVSILSTIFFSLGNITGFALLYTLGNIISLTGTGFLVGFLTQFKKMFDATRIVATCCFLAAMAATLTIAFTVSGPLKFILVIISCVVQFLALVWYSLSYIPFARDMVKRLCGGAMSG